MEAVILFLGLIFLVAPILSIIALIKATGAEKTARTNKQRLEFLYHTLEEHMLASMEEAVAVPKPEPKATVAPVSAPPPLPMEPEMKVAPPSPPTVRPTPAPRPRKNLEEALGGKIAGLIGVMILVAGIAFLVGSPGIAWPSPIFKILMGLAFGGVLLTGGHIADRNASGKYIQLARTMTGGGGGLFYFCIFAAYSLYHLSSPFLTAVGLTASAALLLFLSLVYNSQIVATLGILGAFITPLLVGGDIDQGAFPLAYIALINLPVMFLGIKKNWQVLYNSAYGFTLFYFFYWMLSFNSVGWLVPLVATAVYFAEFITLSLLILWKHDGRENTKINVARIVASTLFLFCSLYLIDAGLWICLACVSVVFAALCKLSWKWLPEYINETLCIILCGIASVALLILEAASGGYIGLLWCAEAVVVAWFFRKPAPLKIKVGSILLCGMGSLALGLQMVDDQTIDPAWFNSETLFIMAGALLIGTCHWIVRRGGKLLQMVSFALILLAAYKDIFDFNSTDVVPWIIATMVFTGASLFIRRWQPRLAEETLHFALSAILCFAIYLHMQLDGLWISVAWSMLGIGTALFALKTQSKEIQNSAIVIGFAGLLHATLQPILNDANLILVNPHTLCGLFTALAIGFQAKLHGRIDAEDQANIRTRLLWFTCIGAVLAIAYRNIFTAMPSDHPMPWLLTSAITLFIGNMVNWMLDNDRTLQQAGRLLIAAVPIKILLFDIGVPWINGDITPSFT